MLQQLMRDYFRFQWRIALFNCISLRSLNVMSQFILAHEFVSWLKNHFCSFTVFCYRRRDLETRHMWRRDYYFYIFHFNIHHYIPLCKCYRKSEWQAQLLKDSECSESDSFWCWHDCNSEMKEKKWFLRKSFVIFEIRSWLQKEVQEWWRSCWWL